MPPRSRRSLERLGLSYDPDVFDSATKLYHAELVNNMAQFEQSKSPGEQSAPPTKVPDMGREIVRKNIPAEVEGPPFPRRFLQLAEAEQRRKEAEQRRKEEAQQRRKEDLRRKSRRHKRRLEEEQEAEQRLNDLRRYEAEAARFVEGFVQELEEVHIVPTMRRSTSTSAKQTCVEIFLDLQRDCYKADHGPAISIGPSPDCSPWISKTDRQLNSMIVQRLRVLGYEVQWLRPLDCMAYCVGLSCFPLARLLSMIQSGSWPTGGRRTDQRSPPVGPLAEQRTNSAGPSGGPSTTQIHDTPRIDVASGYHGSADDHVASGGCISDFQESIYERMHKNRGSTLCWNSGDLPHSVGTADDPHSVGGVSDGDGAWRIRIFL